MKRKIITFAIVALLTLSMIVVSVSAITIENRSINSTNFVNETPATTNTTNKEQHHIPLKHLAVNTKTNIYSKVLNSIDYYNIVSGKIKTNMLNKTDEVIEYNVNMNECKAYQHVNGQNFDEEVYVNDKKIYTFDNLTKKYSIDSAVSKSDEYEENDELLGELDVKERIKYTTLDDEEIKDKELQTIAEDELIPIYYYRDNPTNVHYSSTVSLFPQEMAFGLLSNEELWSISKKISFLNRKCTVIEGKTEKEYGKKLNIQKFELTIDNESGIILDFKGYDQSGTLTSYICTKDVSFSSSEIKELNLNKYRNYTLE